MRACLAAQQIHRRMVPRRAAGMHQEVLAALGDPAGKHAYAPGKPASRHFAKNAAQACLFGFFHVANACRAIQHVYAPVTRTKGQPVVPSIVKAHHRPLAGGGVIETALKRQPDPASDGHTVLEQRDHAAEPVLGLYKIVGAVHRIDSPGKRRHGMLAQGRILAASFLAEDNRIDNAAQAGCQPGFRLAVGHGYQIGRACLGGDVLVGKYAVTRQDKPVACRTNEIGDIASNRIKHDGQGSATFSRRLLPPLRHQVPATGPAPSA